MSWQDDDGHEFGLRCVFSDGTSGGAYARNGILATTDADGYSLPSEQWQWHPQSDVVGWAVSCICPNRRAALTLARWVRVDDPSDDNGEDRFYVDGHVADLEETRPEVEEAMRVLWDAHRTPAKALAAVREANRNASAAAAALNSAVADARAAGLSWTYIGEATAMSRQSARERWAKYTDAPEH